MFGYNNNKHFIDISDWEWSFLIFVIYDRLWWEFLSVCVLSASNTHQVFVYGNVIDDGPSQNSMIWMNLVFRSPKCCDVSSLPISHWLPKKFNSEIGCSSTNITWVLSKWMQQHSLSIVCMYISLDFVGHVLHPSRECKMIELTNVEAGEKILGNVNKKVIKMFQNLEYKCNFTTKFIFGIKWNCRHFVVVIYASFSILMFNCIRCTQL